MKKFAALLCVLLLSGLGWAIVEYGQLSVVVTDVQNNPLPGASITIESDALIGGPRTQLSNESGESLFIQLRPGDYTVTCQMEGFQVVKNEKVKVSLDRTTKLIVKLQTAQEFQETVVVTGAAPVVDPTQTNVGSVFDETYLQETAIGSGGRSYQSVLTQAGGVTGSGNVNVLGSTGGENNYLIDGLSTTDPVTATFGTNFNFDAIQEISFQTGGFEAEYGQATGGIVNVVTKSGSNAFEGSFDIRYSNETFYEGSDNYPPWDPYDPSRDETWFYNPAVSLGGPILKDKVWFFVSAQTDQTEITPAGVDYSYKWDGQNYLAKVTWQISPNDTLIGKWSSDPAAIHNVDASIWVAEEAATRQDQGGDIWQADYSRILSESLLFTAKLGVNQQYLDAYPESGDLTSPPYYDLYTGYTYNNAFNAQFSDRDRVEGLFSLTWFKNNLAGDHTFKMGGEYHDVSFDYLSFTPGDRAYYTYDYTGDGAPDSYLKYVYEPQFPYSNEGIQWTVYLQDEWKVLPNLTFKPGVRYDAVEYTNDAGVKIADMDMFQPRIGMAWDIFNNAKTVVRGYYGTFMHPSALTLPDFLRSEGSGYQSWVSAEFLADYFGMTPEEVCEYFGPCDDEGYIFNNEFVGAPNQTIDALKPTYAEQWNIGFEQEIAPRTGVELTYVQKRTKDIMEDTCGGYDEDGNFIDPWDYLDDPDSYDFWSQCQFFVMRNNPYALRYYYGYILKFESRYKDWFHLMLDYTYSKAYESVGYTQNAGADFDLPIHYVNRYGYAGGDNRHYLKLNGYFYLPANFTLGFNAFYRTGRPLTIYTDRYGADGDDAEDDNNDDWYSPPTYGTLFLTKRGSYGRLPSVWWVDFQASWAFNITEGIKSKLILSVNNLFNREAVLGRCTRVWSTNPDEPGAGDQGCGSATTADGEAYPVNFGDDIAWQTPRSYEVGLRIEF
jgi:outer membrane receptor for Fe3+-dicitrate